MRDQKHIDYINAIQTINISFPDSDLINKEAVHLYLKEKGINKSLSDYLKDHDYQNINEIIKKLKTAVDTLDDLASQRYLDSDSILPVINDKYKQFNSYIDLFDNYKEEWVYDCYKKAIDEVNSSNPDTIMHGIEELKVLKNSFEKAGIELAAAEEKLKAIQIKKQKKQKKNLMIGGVIATVIIAAAVICGVIISGRHVNKGDKFLANGQYDEAIAEYEHSGNKEKVLEAKYQQALFVLDNGQFDDAKGMFSALGDYSNSSEMVSECVYQKALNQLESGDKSSAYDLFETIIDYKDSKDIEYYTIVEDGLKNSDISVNIDPKVDPWNGAVNLTEAKRLLDEVSTDFRDTASYSAQINNYYQLMNSFAGDWVGGINKLEVTYANGSLHFEYHGRTPGDYKSGDITAWKTNGNSLSYGIGEDGDGVVHFFYFNGNNLEVKPSPYEFYYYYMDTTYTRS